MSFLFKSSSQPQQQSTPQAFAPQFSEEQKPYLKEIFGQAQTQYEAEKERGYTPFPGPQLAPFTPEEQQSFEMYRNIATGPGAQPYFDAATQAAMASAAPITAQQIAGLSPTGQAGLTQQARNMAMGAASPLTQQGVTGLMAPGSAGLAQYAQQGLLGLAGPQTQAGIQGLMAPGSAAGTAFAQSLLRDTAGPIGQAEIQGLMAPGTQAMTEQARQLLGQAAGPTTQAQVAGLLPAEQQAAADYARQQLIRAGQDVTGAEVAGFMSPEQRRLNQLAEQATIASGAPIGTADIQRLMSPYQQQVTQRAQEEAVRDYMAGPLAQLRASATEAGGLRGSRRAITEAEGERNLAQRLADIETTGLQGAYDRAIAASEAERQRLAQMGAALPGIGSQQYQAALQSALAQRGQQAGIAAQMPGIGSPEYFQALQATMGEKARAADIAAQLPAVGSAQYQAALQSGLGQRGQMADIAARLPSVGAPEYYQAAGLGLQGTGQQADILRSLPGVGSPEYYQAAGLGLQSQGQMADIASRLPDIGTGAYYQGLGAAAGELGRQAGLAQMLPGLGTGLTTAQQQQAALLGGVGELQRQQQQQAIDLARQEFAAQEAYPTNVLSRYLGFISGAPQPGGSVASTQTVQGPSSLAQFAGLVGGLGTLAGGLGGDAGFARFFTKASGGRVGGLSSIVRRQAGGRIVRMADGGPPPFDPYNRAIDQGPPSKSFLDIISELGVAKAIQSIADTGGIFDERAKALSGNVPLKTTGKPQEMRGVIADYGTEFQPRTPYDEAALPAVSEAEVDPTPVEGATTGELTAPAVTSSPEAKATYFDSPLQERFAAYLKLTNPDPEDKPMTWSQRLQLAGALMAAGSTPGTGSFLGDLAAFGGAAGLAAGKVLTEKEKRDREAALRKGQLYRDFLSYEAGLRGEAREQQKLDILRRGEDIKARKYISELREIAVPKTLQIEQAQGFLQEAYPDQFVASKMKKGQYGTTGTDVDLATIAATLKTDIPSAFAVAQAAGAVMRDQDRNLTIDARRAIDAAVLGRASSTRPTAKATRSESGTLNVPTRAEGGRLTLRYPEDF